MNAKGIIASLKLCPEEGPGDKRISFNAVKGLGQWVGFPPVG